MNIIYGLAEDSKIVYVGQTTRPKQREYSHRHYHPGLEFIPIEECEKNNLDDREEFWIAKLDTYRTGLNKTRKAAYQPWNDPKHRDRMLKMFRERENPAKGRRWYYKGDEEKLLHECPDGWIAGRKPAMKESLQANCSQPGARGPRKNPYKGPHPNLGKKWKQKNPRKTKRLTG